MPGILEGMEGVFVEGKPLCEFLEDEERDDKSRQIEDVRKQGEKRQKQTVVYGDEKKPLEDTRRVAKRVKHYTDREIRKEFGIMKKPFGSHAENAVWAIWEKGPLSTKEVGAEIEYSSSQSSLSAMVSTIWHRLGHMHPGAACILERSSHHGTFQYQKKSGVDISVEQAIEKYKLTGSKQYKVANGKAKPSLHPNSSSSKLADDIKQVVSKHLGLKVEVSGRIDVVFRWER